MDKETKKFLKYMNKNKDRRLTYEKTIKGIKGYDLPYTIKVYKVYELIKIKWKNKEKIWKDLDFICVLHFDNNDRMIWGRALPKEYLEILYKEIEDNE